MHKRLVNRCIIDITLIPQGPVLIKASDQGADPTKPDMEFVETYHNGRTIYLPGSSLKGAIRAHAERICRTVGKEERHKKSEYIWANDPLNNTPTYQRELGHAKGADVHKLSSFIDRLFGNTALGSRFKIKDAYPDPEKPLILEERNGVAIDRVFGSTHPGALFNYQVCTAGEFRTQIQLKNFSLAQLGLIGLVLRDLAEGWFGIGFAKSRGLGFMDVHYNRAIIQYPTCVLQDDNTICQLGSSQTPWDRQTLLGVGELLNFPAGEGLTQKEYEKYGMAPNDFASSVPMGGKAMPLGLGVEIDWPVDQINYLFEPCVKKWQALIPHREAA